MNLSGWGNVPCHTSNVVRPEKINEVRDLVAAPEVASVIARGLGRSYGDAALNADARVLLDTHLDRLLSFDPASGVLECEVGVSFADLLHFFLPRGFFPAVTPGTKYVTVGGAIAADVHGKNHHRDGSISNFVESFELLLASGLVIRCSRQENADAFWATIGGMGLTGILLTARLRKRPVKSAYLIVDYQKARDLDQVLELFAQGDEQYQYSVAWIDCLASGSVMGRSVLMRGNHALATDLPAHLQAAPLAVKPKRKRGVPFYFPKLALSPMTVRLFNNRYYKRQKEGRRIVDYDTFFYPLDSIQHWNRIYGMRGFFQYQAVFPRATARACLVELLEKLTDSRRASFLAVLKTMGAAGGGLLSFPMEGQTLALDIPNDGPATVSFLQELDAIVLRHGGRVYLAKDACLTPESFRAMYPDHAKFRQIKQQLDPQNRFSSSLSRRLRIGEAP